MSDASVIPQGEISASKLCLAFVRAGQVVKTTLVVFAGAAFVMPVYAGSPPSSTPQTAVVWGGGEGFWSVPANWGLGPAVDPLFSVVAIDAGNQSYSWVNMDVNASLLRLAIDENDTLNVMDGRTLSIDGPNAVVQCNGVIRLDAKTQPTSFLVGSNITVPLLGGGRVKLLNESLATIAASGASASLDIQGTTIEGTGRLGANSLSIRNDGLVNASMPFQSLTVDPSAGGFQNLGELRASNSGRLRLVGGSFLNQDGLIHADAGSRIDMDGVTVTGGLLQTSGSGLIRVSSAPVTLADVNLNGQFELGISKLSLLGQIVNNGVMLAVAGNTIAGGGGPVTDFSEVLIPPGSGDVRLGGSGVLDMQLAKVHSGSTQIGGRLINMAGHTLKGSGAVGNGTAGFLNQGTVLADSGYPILIDTKPGDTFINSGLIRATGSGGVMFNNGTFRNDGTIEVHDGSKVFYTVSATESNASAGTLSGGIWKVFGAEAPTSIVLSGPGIIFNNANVTLSGPGSSFQAFNTMQVNNGSFTLDQGRMFTTFGTSFSNQGNLQIGGGSRLNVNGTFTQGAAGVLRFVLGPSSIGVTTPALNVTGTANLGGTVEIQLAPGFVPQDGQVLHLIGASTINGSFAHIVAPAGLQITYTIGEVAVDVNGFCRGDLNLDGLVSDPDIGVLLQQWGTCPVLPTSCLSDLNGDGRVNQIDLSILLSLLGICD